MNIQRLTWQGPLLKEQCLLLCTAVICGLNKLCMADSIVADSIVAVSLACALCLPRGGYYKSSMPAGIVIAHKSW